LSQAKPNKRTHCFRLLKRFPNLNETSRPVIFIRRKGWSQRKTVGGGKIGQRSIASMKRTFLFVLVIAALALSACGGDTSANHLDAIKQAGVIKVGTSADYPPFESVDKSGNKVGFDIDLMTEIAKQLGVKLEWVDMPFDSLIAGVQEKKIDAAISSMNYTDERAKQVTFTDPYYTLEDSFLVSDNFKGQIKSEEDITQYTIGVQTGTTQDTYLSDLVKSGKLKENKLFRYDRADQAALDLKSGRIEVLMADSDPARMLAKQVGGIKVAYSALLTSGPVNIALPLNDNNTAKAINEILNTLKSNGFIDQLVQKHLATQ
jgi:polar amino acid transport system substrate-binding protein